MESRESTRKKSNNPQILNKMQAPPTLQPQVDELVAAMSMATRTTTSPRVQEPTTTMARRTVPKGSRRRSPTTRRSR